ncbi:hypothetical protein ACFPYI_08150 [Halomarina salina]|uniref:Uncharacterized protein n=1 Tax=Halomarina salina TaxID=1872699 RepID=A0ABD5RLL0_9EURY
MAESDDPAPGTPGETVPERPGTANFVRALNVRRNARIGVGVGVVFAAVVYAVRVFELLGPAPDSAGSLYFLMLAFVLASGVALLVTLGLTVRSAARRARELD